MPAAPSISSRPESGMSAGAAEGSGQGHIGGLPAFGRRSSLRPDS
jgi:hypothetical protein